LTNPEGKQHPLAIDQKLMVWTVSGKQTLVKSLLKSASKSLRPEKEVQKLPGKSGIAGVLGTKLIPFDAL